MHLVAALHIRLVVAVLVVLILQVVVTNKLAVRVNLATPMELLHSSLQEVVVVDVLVVAVLVTVTVTTVMAEIVLVDQIQELPIPMVEIKDIWQLNILVPLKVEELVLSQTLADLHTIPLQVLALITDKG
jgi:hypothetical protein